MKTKTRIWILPFASAALFLVGVVILVLMAANTSATIRSIGATSYPAMDLTTRFDRRLESLVATIQGAVAEGDQKRLDEAKATGAEARKLLVDLKALGFEAREELRGPPHGRPRRRADHARHHPG